MPTSGLPLRRASRSGFLAQAALALLPACAGVANGHLGPITGIAVSGPVSVHCSPGCVEIRANGSSRWLPVPDGRAVAVAVFGADAFVVGGGVPARSGWLRVLSRAGAWGAGTDVAGDVFGAVAACADGTVAAGAADGSVWLWSPGGSPPRRVANHNGAARALAFLPDRVLVSAGRDGRILMIDPATDRARELLDHTSGVECIAMARDGSFASGARDGRVRVHDQGGRLLRTWQRLSGSVLALLEHEQGFLCGMDDGRLLLLRPGHEAAAAVFDCAEPIHVLARQGQVLLLGTQTRSLGQQWPAAIAGAAGSWVEVSAPDQPDRRGVRPLPVLGCDLCAVSAEGRARCRERRRQRRRDGACRAGMGTFSAPRP